MFILEVIAAITGIVAVSLIIKQNIWAWPIGNISVVLYAFILFHAKLYSDALLHIGYIILNSYCWYSWAQQDKNGIKEISYVKRLPVQVMLMMGSVLVIGSVLLGYFMATQTDADLPYWDAFIVVLSIFAQSLLANRYLAAWSGWVVVNVLSVGLYWVKGLYPTTILYAIYLGLAILGLIKWHTIFREQELCRLH